LRLNARDIALSASIPRREIMAGGRNGYACSVSRSDAEGESSRNVLQRDKLAKPEHGAKHAPRDAIPPLDKRAAS
jgi:hypothetical protein